MDGAVRPREAEPERPSGDDREQAAVDGPDARLRCPYCHDGLAVGDLALACGGCGAHHHATCFTEHGRCATCACPRHRTTRVGVVDHGPATGACAGCGERMPGEAWAARCGCGRVLHVACYEAQGRCGAQGCAHRQPQVARMADLRARAAVLQALVGGAMTGVGTIAALIAVVAALPSARRIGPFVVREWNDGLLGLALAMVAVAALGVLIGGEALVRHQRIRREHGGPPEGGAAPSAGLRTDPKKDA